MSGVNKVILVGNLGAKPELRYTPQGTPVCNFNIATTERWGTDETGERREHTEWHRIVAWRKLAEICGQYLDKGTKVYIEGRLRTESWVGKEDNVKRYMTKVIADQMVILSPKGVREQVADYPDETTRFPGEAEPKPEAVATGGDKTDTLDLEEDVDFF